MSKFNVGDHVRVISVPNSVKNSYAGKILTIASVCPNKNMFCDATHYGVTDRKCPYIFFDDEFELIEFIKADLKDGMVVEFNNKIRGIVLRNAILMVNKSIDLNEFDELLNHVEKKPYTIKKVYNSTAESISSYLCDETLELVWERKE